MSDLVLLRLGTDDIETQGVLRIGQRAFAVTLELPWRDNEPEISCIPAGTYTCQRLHSPRFGNTFEVLQVPNRSHILFHKGNVVPDTKGCILVGENFDALAIRQSGQAFEEFMLNFADRETFILTVLDVNRYLPIDPPAPFSVSQI
jgi:hypothetical protein